MGIAPTSSGTAPSIAPIETHELVSPIRPLILERELTSHPDKGFVSQLLQTFTSGCNIGYNGPHFAHIASHLPTAHTHPNVIDNALAKECSAGRIAGPFPSPPLPSLRCSGLGVVPKKDGTWRVIYHLSAPHSRSINDYINPESFSLSYCSIDDAIMIINQLGPGCLLGKIDLKNAFRLCPVRKQDWHLLGIHWKGLYYVDKCLPFGLRSAPYLFNQLAQAIEWILKSNYRVTNLIHYLDDFLTAGPPQSEVCSQHMATMLSVCHRLGAPVKPEKVEGPSTTLTFLGIQLDTRAMQASITPDRKQELLGEVQKLRSHHTCTKQRLLSLIGKLAFACKVVPPGRIFLRRLIDLSTSVGPLHHHITLNHEAHLDLDWWHQFLPEWPGTSMLLESEWTLAPHMHLYTDASNLGFGAYWDGAWFNSAWSPHQTTFPINWKELFAIVVTCATWGKHWVRKRILFHCDNAAVVDIWQKRSCRSPALMTLVRTLYYLAAKGNYHVGIAHIPGASNLTADSLSRFSMQAFRRLRPHADPQPTPLCLPSYSTTL